MFKRFTASVAYLIIFISSNTISQQLRNPESEILEMLETSQPYHVVSESMFERLGWSLPDNGETVKKLADSAIQGTLDPRKLESIPASVTGYKSRWHRLRYDKYGLQWDITGLHLTPENSVKGLPTLVLIHGGSSNWYEFFLDPLNNPGIGQYLAQRVPVLLVTIPGNFRYGGWIEEELGKRTPAYLLDKEFTDEEVAVRTASYTFKLVADGVKQLIEHVTNDDVVIIGHSTAGEIPYMLQGTTLQQRMHGKILGWGSGGTSSQKAMQDRWGYTQTVNSYPPIERMRPRPIDNYSGDYLGPLNPVWEEGLSREEIAKRWMGIQEFQRRPHFKQPLQDMERRGAISGMMEGTINQVIDVLKDNPFGVDAEKVVSDLFSPLRAPITGYQKIILTTARLDTGHWNKDNPEMASTFQMANELRRLNPHTPVRVLLFDVPMTHYGHVERPKQLAAGLYTALVWLSR